MSKHSQIQWTEDTWNPLAGCSKVSEGCKNCYAIRMSNRLSGMNLPYSKYVGVVKNTNAGGLNWTGQIQLHWDSLQIPLKMKKATLYFVNSMSDLFHDQVPFEFIYKVFEVMHLTPRHTYQVLTKRAERLKELENVYFHLKRNYPNAEFPSKNVWIGVSVENQERADERIPLLVQVKAAIRWLSIEPLLAPVNLAEIRPGTFYYFNCLSEPILHKGYMPNVQGLIRWVVAGGESGPGARPMHPDWVRLIRDQCEKAKVPFFFKQWGEYTSEDQISKSIKCNENSKRLIALSDGTMVQQAKVGKKKAGRVLDGVIHDEMPKKSKHGQ